MALYLFSSFAGSTISFNPSFDLLLVDVGSAASLEFSSGFGLTATSNGFTLGLGFIDIASLHDSNFEFTDGSVYRFGSSASDSLAGTTHEDRFDLGGGGDDTASGGAGADVFMARDGLGGGDRIDGGANAPGAVDELRIEGPTHVVLQADTVTGIERFTIGGNAAVSLGLHDNLFVTADGSVRFDAGAQGPLGSFTLDGSAITVAGIDASGGGGGDSLTGGALADHLRGGAGSDTLSGGAGADTLDGGAGQDTLTGGSGDDTFDFAFGTSTSDSTPNQPDTIDDFRSGDRLLLPAATPGGLLLAWRASAPGDLFGSNFQSDGEGFDGVADVLWRNPFGSGPLELWVDVDDDGSLGGSDLRVVLPLVAGGPVVLAEADFASAFGAWKGHDGADQHTGSAASERLWGRGGDDTLVGGGGDDTLDGGDGNDSLSGGDGSDSLTGGSGDDRIVVDTADAGADGGAGSDVLVLAFGAAPVVDLQNAADQAQGGGAETGFEGADAAAAGSAASLHGDASANTLIGGAFADLLDGRGGADTMTGGGGDDIYVVDSALDTIVESSGGGIDEVRSGGGSIVLQAWVENLRLPDDRPADGSGNALDNVFFAGAASNSMDGAAGRDTVSYASAAGPVQVSLAIAGYQPTGASSDDRLIGIENLVGGAFGDTLTGDAFANVLSGGGGADTLSGGDGSDTYDVDLALDLVVETNAVSASGGFDLVRSSADAYTLGAHVENLRLIAASASDGTGNALNNTLYAGAGNNLLAGAGGTDTVSYQYAAAAVQASLAVAGFQFTGGSGFDAFDSIENLSGSAFDDALTGDAGANVLNGGAGTDTLSGLGGNDTYVVDRTGDQTIESDANPASGGTDLVLTALAAWTLAANVENLRLSAAGSANGTGNGLANTLFAGAGNNVLNGAGGSDTVSYLYAASAVVANLALSGAQATGGSGSDTFVSIENLTGSAFADTLSGNASANVLDGGAGVDTLAGGDGSDTYVVDQVGDVVTETNASAATGGSDTVHSKLATYTLGANLEHLRLLAAGTASGTGNSLANTLYAGAGNNVLNGAGGTDTVSYLYAGAAVTASLSIAGAQATGGSGTDTFVSIERLSGSAFADSLTGSAAADVLDGGAGADRLTGLGGNDTYVVDHSGDVVVEGEADPALGGTDTVQSHAAAWTMAANVEQLRLMSAGTAAGTGNAQNNTIFAGAGNNAINGGGGTDTVSYLYAGAAVTASLAISGAQATGGSGSDSFTSIENLSGSAFADTLTGNASANLLDGGQGADLMTGGDGSDTYVVDQAGDLVVETNANAATGGTDTLQSFLAATTLGANVENLRLSAAGSADGTGNGLANTLYAGAGNNVLNGAGGSDTVSYLYAASAIVASLAVTVAQATGGSGSDTFVSIENLSGSAFADTLSGNASANVLDGGAGADTLAGGDGSDTYVVDDAFDLVTETNASVAAGGSDTVQSRLAAWTMGANLENLRLLAAGVANGTGNSLNNVLYAGGGDNVLDGAGGSDTVSYQFAGGGVFIELDRVGPQSTGGSGSDTLVSIESAIGSAFSDLLFGSALANTLRGGAGADSLFGRAGNDLIDGGADADQIGGEAGVDTLTGGAGIDAFVLTPHAAGEVDRITDLEVGERMLIGVALQPLLLAGDDASALARGQAMVGTPAGGVTRLRIGTDDAPGADVAVDLAGSFGVGEFVVSAISPIFLVRDPSLNAPVSRSGTALADTIEGGPFDDTLSGLGGDDRLYGGAGDDQLLGGDGTDLLTGGAGADTLDGGGGSDFGWYLDAGGGVQVDLGTGIVTGADGDDLLLGVENLQTSGFDDVIVGSADGNFLSSNGGNDRVDGGGGSDQLSGGGGSDTLIGGAGVDMFTFDAGQAPDVDRVNDLERGETLFFRMTLSPLLAGDDGSGLAQGQVMVGTPVGGATPLFVGRDAVPGADLRIDIVGRFVVEDFGVPSGESLLYQSQDRSGGAGADTLTGAATSDRLDGGDGNDLLQGLGGHDLLIGGAGNDSLDGGTHDDVLDGGAGTDTLNGGSGADSMSGGDGSDTYMVDDAGDQVSETNAVPASGGYDAVWSTRSFTLGAHVENLRLNAGGAIDGTGNDLGNVLWAGSGDNLLAGGLGSDTVSYAYAAAAVQVSLALAGAQATGGSGSDTLASIEGLAGSPFADSLSGNAAANTLTGSAGNDTLSGGGGADSFVLNSSVGSDTITDFASALDKLRLSQAVFGVGDADLVVEDAVAVPGPGGFAPAAELVVVSSNLAGAITAAAAAAAIGSATSAYAAGRKALFAVDNGIDSALFLFTSAGADAAVSAVELKLLALLQGTPSTVAADVVLGA